MIAFLLVLFPAVPAEQKKEAAASAEKQAAASAAHQYTAGWNYNCLAYAPPKFFEIGIYSNGKFIRIGQQPVKACVANQRFTAYGSSTLITSTTQFYVRGIGATGIVGPATFWPVTAPAARKAGKIM